MEKINGDGVSNPSTKKLPWMNCTSAPWWEEACNSLLGLEVRKSEAENGLIWTFFTPDLRMDA